MRLWLLGRMSENGIVTTLKRSLSGEIAASTSKIQKNEEIPPKKAFLEDKDVGIEEYLSPEKPIFGVLKHRFTDFLVNEIDLKGEVVRLKSLTYVPKSGSAEDNREQLIKNLTEMIGEEAFQKLEKLNEVLRASPNSKENVILKNEENKEKRTQLHQGIKALFPSLGSETTETKETGKCIKIWGKKQGTVRQDWRDDEQYTKFALYKENRDTMDCVGVLSRLLRINPKGITFAGTKDKRGVTVQWVTIWKMLPARLAGINKNAYGFRLGNFCFQSEPLRLGDLQGNRFSILIRKIETEISEIERSVEHLKTHGFVNYYGMQRFGNSTPTYMMGIHLLKGDWQQVADYLLMPNENDYSAIGKAKQKWKVTRDPEQVLKLLPPRSFLESRFLSGLIKFGKNNYLHAFSQIPRSMRLLYLHSLQSLIWNKVVTKRLQKFGPKPIVGDLVYVPTVTPKGKEKENQESSKEKEKDQGKGKGKDKNKNKGKGKEDQDDTLESEEVEEKKTIRIEDLKVLEEADLSKFTIFDVVLPTPGTEIILPSNEVGQYYLDILKEFDLSMESFHQNHKEFALYGNYRKMVGLPKDMEWEIIKHDDPDAQLTLTDLEILEGKTLELKNEGKYKALRVDFSLDTSSYATMALREILKSNTSSAFYTNMNQQENPEILEGDGGEEVTDLNLEEENVDNTEQTIEDEQNFKL